MAKKIITDWEVRMQQERNRRKKDKENVYIPVFVKQVYSRYDNGDYDVDGRLDNHVFPTQTPILTIKDINQRIDRFDGNGSLVGKISPEERLLDFRQTNEALKDKKMSKEGKAFIRTRLKESAF